MTTHTISVPLVHGRWAAIRLVTNNCYLLPVHSAGPPRSKSWRDIEPGVTVWVGRLIFRGVQTSRAQVKAWLTCTIWHSRAPGFWTVCRQESLWWLPAETLTEQTAGCRPCKTLWCPCRTCSRDGERRNTDKCETLSVSGCKKKQITPNFTHFSFISRHHVSNSMESPWLDQQAPVLQL